VYDSEGIDWAHIEFADNQARHFIQNNWAAGQCAGPALCMHQLPVLCLPAGVLFVPTSVLCICTTKCVICITGVLLLYCLCVYCRTVWT
jgi:hypothetical protein